MYNSNYNDVAYDLTYSRPPPQQITPGRYHSEYCYNKYAPIPEYVDQEVKASILNISSRS